MVSTGSRGGFRLEDCTQRTGCRRPIARCASCFMPPGAPSSCSWPPATSSGATRSAPSPSRSPATACRRCCASSTARGIRRSGTCCCAAPMRSCRCGRCCRQWPSSSPPRRWRCSSSARPSVPATIALVLFGAFGMYEYAVVARNYGISMLVLFALAALYPRWRDRGVTIGLVLALLCNTNVPAALLAAAFLLFWLVELVGEEGLRWHRKYAWFAANCAVAAAGALLCFVTVYPTVHDAAAIQFHGSITPAIVWSAISTPAYSFGAFLPPFVRPNAPRRRLARSAHLRQPARAAPLARRLPSALVVFVGFELFFQLIYPGYYRHEALLLVYLVTLYWLAGEGRGGAWPAHWRLEERLGRAPDFGRILFLAPARAPGRDRRRPRRRRSQRHPLQPLARPRRSAEAPAPDRRHPHRRPGHPARAAVLLHAQSDLSDAAAEVSPMSSDSPGRSAATSASTTICATRAACRHAPGAPSSSSSSAISTRRKVRSASPKSISGISRDARAGPPLPGGHKPHRQFWAGDHRRKL